MSVAMCSGIRSPVLVGALLAAAQVGAPAAMAAQMDHGPVVTNEWLRGHLDDPNVVVLQVDRRSAYDEGHIPGARFLDMSDLVWEGDPAWGAELRTVDEVRAALMAAGLRDGAHHVVLYGSSPLGWARAFMTLEVMGLRGRVQVLDGGLQGWVAAGGPLSTEEPEAVAGGDLTLIPRDDVVVSADWIHDRLDDERIALVDARPDDEYTGADGGMGGRTNPGHIPGARQLYWEELIVSRDEPSLLDRDELERLFREAGAAQGDTVVTYCMIGMRASFTYLVSRMLGYETRFYDGSWHEWGTRDDLPTVTGRDPGGR